MSKVAKKTREAVHALRRVTQSAKRLRGKVERPQKVELYWGRRGVAAKSQSVLTQSIRSSKVIGAQTGEKILKYVASASEASAKRGRKARDMSAVIANAILASDFSKGMDRWLRDSFTKGESSIYDKSMDAMYNATHTGGGHHRLFDGSHTLWGAWDKVQEASPDDTMLQEIGGLATGLAKDLVTPAGLPLFTMDKSTYDQFAEALSSTFNIPKSWAFDLLNVNGTELLGASIGTIAVALNWNKGDVKRFSSLASSFGISSLVAANPALAVVALATLAKAYTDARHKGDYRQFIDGLSKGGVVTGVFLATASAVGGPVWIGLLSGLCVGVVAHKVTEKVSISEIGVFIESSMKKALNATKGAEQMSL